MSGLLSGKVWQSNLDPHLKPLAASLADIGNDDGTSIYPSVAYMSWLLGKSERAVQDGLAELRAAKVLRVVSQGGGRGNTTEYVLDESALPWRRPWAEERATRKGATVAPLEIKGAVSDTKGCNEQQERVQPTAPEPLVTVRNRQSRKARFLRSDESDLERTPETKIEQWLFLEAEERWGKAAVKKGLDRFGDRFHLWSKAKGEWKAGAASLRDCLERAAASLAQDDTERAMRDLNYSQPIDPDIWAATLRRTAANKAIERALGLEMIR